MEQLKQTIDVMQEAKEAIRTAEASIADQREKTSNSWADCFISVLTTVQNYVSLAFRKSVISEENNSLFQSRIEAVVSKIKLVREKYGSENSEPPSSVREELLRDLDIFRE